MDSPTTTTMSYTVVRRLIAAWFRDPTQFYRNALKFACPICNYHGIFVSVGRPTRWDARCPNCGSRERHRLTWLWLHENGENKFAGKRILHFAPEKIWMRIMKGNPNYETADLLQKGVTHQVDFTNVPLPDESYDVVMAHHVLEHIDDDKAAMDEMYRLLKHGGTAILSVPLNPSRDETCEGTDITDPEMRRKMFNGTDHKRMYGLDFADKLRNLGFEVETFRLTPQLEAVYGLLKDEWIYIARKP
jgi:hypothetical protein